MKSRPRIALLVVGFVVAAGIVLVREMPRRSTRERGSASASRRSEAVVRVPAVAGAFYPGDRAALLRDVQHYLSHAERKQLPGELVALIAPHAGYMYSGPVAAYAYRQLEGRHYDAVVVIGPSHRAFFSGVALSAADKWATPLGSVEVDRAAVEALQEAYRGARVFEPAHEEEHSIEVQLPFLQTVLGGFKLLPILMADDSPETCSDLGQALAKWARGRSVLLIASSDMSHYPTYDDAVRVDGETLKAIGTLDPQKVAATTKKLMSQGTPGLSTCLCGEGPVRAVLEAARLLGADRAEVLRHANSGDVPAGTRDRVVGYCAVAITGKEVGTVRCGEGGLNAAQQQRLLSVGRAAIEGYVRTGKRPDIHEDDPALLRPAAAFVTLREEGQLRGCIGILEARMPLIETVSDRAILAATGDPRFPPVRAEELARLEVEISVLSPLRKVSSADEIDISKHGVVVESGGRAGVFLPQVAEETGWSREVLLSHLCRDKAGLPSDAWKQGADLFVFTVQAFSSPAPG